MLKTILIGLKDVKLALRDRGALVLMLLAPFLLTIGMGFVTGRLSGGSGGGLSAIPVVLVDQDGGQLGKGLVDLFFSDSLADLVEASQSSDLASARQLVDDDQTAALVLIPAGFTNSIIPNSGETKLGEPVNIEIYANPVRPVSSGVVQAIVEEFISQVEIGRIGGQVTVMEMINSGLIDPSQAEAVGRAMGESQADQSAGDRPIRINVTTQGEAPVEFDVLAYMAPGMALMFLMFTVSYGGRSILTERNQGTLPRLLVTPTSIAQVLGGKVFGVYLTGVLQVGVLILASALLFNLKWGSPGPVIALVLAACFGATGWGMLLTAAARTPGQIASLGSALMLMFGILGGSFISLDNLPAAIQWVSKITPNAWGLQGFNSLALGGDFSDILLPVGALLLMGMVLFGIAVALFNRSKILQR